MEKQIRKKKSNFGAWTFFIATVLIYIFLALVKFNSFIKSSNFAIKVFVKIIPIFILVWILMAFVDRYFSADFVAKHFPKGSIRGWLFAIITGILSGGAIYLWYPLLLKLREKGVGNGIIACFLYNRAIKIYLLPVAIYYFGLKYVLILTVVMILASIAEGFTVEWLAGKN
ncbi:MAG TPA: hypothetical protein ENL06_00665 [Candidatus Portnoybacteria bacterium]|nr:hypothetical protein [Candidatus Portnoybacteria bacterium]